MQQRGSNTTMDSEESDNSSSTTSCRTRNNAKLKVLVRSHAMREETSPPREPSPNHQHLNQPHQQPLHSPCITVIPSPEVSSSPLVVLSPSAGSPTPLCKSPQCLSPTATLVPSPNNNSRSSPNLSASSDVVSPNDRLDMDHQQDGNYGEYATSSPKFANKTNSSKQASHSYKRKNACECQTQNCLKCVKNQQQEKIFVNSATNANGGSPNTLTVSRAGSKTKLRQQSSSLGSFDSSINSPCLSRDNSSELYTDTTGVDLELFIPETLNRNAKDRALMLRIEQELVSLAKDKTKTHYKFPPMSSYQRMLVHRCAAYFGMDHNIEPTGKCVVVNKTKNTRIPEVEFKEHIKEDIIFSEEPRRSILKRDSNSIDDYSFKSPDRSYGSDSRRSKSFEEREEEYEKARRRIFNREFFKMRDESSEDFGWSEIPWSSTESEYSSRYRLQTPDMHHRHAGKLLFKGHSEDPGEAMRPCVSKSYSFGGYGGNLSVLSRGDSVMSTHSAGPRLLTKQGRVFVDSGASSVSWRLSPSSSGYKSQSQMSESVTPSPTSTPHLTHPDVKEDSILCGEDNKSSDKNHIIWAVSNIHNVPKGSLIINPQTGQPLKNEDGTIYHYDPNNLLPEISSPAKTHHHSSPLKSPHKEIHDSPKKPHSDTLKPSPSKKSQITHSSTSPTLPYSPPVVAAAAPELPQKSYSFSQPDQQQAMQQYGSYHAAIASPPAADPGPFYQQPCVIYSTPYGLYQSQQYDNRLDYTADVSNSYYLPEASGAPQVTYQAPQAAPYWNQTIAYYQNGGPVQSVTPPRYSSVPLQTATQPAYVSTSYPQTYMTSPTQQIQNSAELQPVYPSQPMVMYQNQPTPPTYYQNQPPMVYSQNAVYASQGYPSQMAQPVPHPHNMTPNSGASSAMQSGHDAQTLYNLTQSIQQMNLGGTVPCPTFVANRGAQLPCDVRQRPSSNGLKSKPFKCFFVGSGQSSAGTNSPAATVIAGYCPQGSAGMYRTPPETPPAQFAYPPNFASPIILKQVPRASTPGTAKSSRSPTPAGDVSYFDRQKMALPSNLYQGMPYMVPATDPRLVSGRGQPNIYRPNAQMTRPNNQAPDNRSNNKNRKTKTNKQQCGLPPSGK
ncbi:unnamed protein product [Phyllotreta striolata]|uniref:cAMP-regulated phosphoprotein 21 n=1 Tax=Phyllotreta striolata TaxID=444603 RepID=A0A9N9TT65_PHYSR|nr:unnamed protein product [Phyllotreta striolata]